MGFAIALAATIALYAHPRTHALSLEVANELMKVTWPSWPETRASTFAVVVASLVAALLLFFIDTVAYKLMVDWLPSVWEAVMAMKWYVVHTYSNFENQAKKSLEEKIRLEELRDQFGEILIPMEQVVEIGEGGEDLKRKFFPGYIVQMDLNDRTWHLVKNTPKITGFPGAAPERAAHAHLRQGGEPPHQPDLRGRGQGQAEGAVRGRRHRARDRRALRQLQRHRGRGQRREEAASRSW